MAELQSPDGSWETDAPGNVGSPATYGRVAGHCDGLRTLRAADAMKYRAAIDKAVAWFEDSEARSVLDAAATLLALADVPGERAAVRRRQCLQVIGKGQSSDGGWGPFVNSPPECFDTALVLLALAAQRHDASQARTIERGRAFLLAAQEPDGGWPPTTRPSGVDSYAQRLSTSGWATQALLATPAK